MLHHHLATLIQKEEFNKRKNKENKRKFSPPCHLDSKRRTQKKERRRKGNFTQKHLDLSLINVHIFSAELVHPERVYVRPVHQSMILFAVGPMLRTKVSISCAISILLNETHKSEYFLISLVFCYIKCFTQKWVFCYAISIFLMKCFFSQQWVFLLCHHFFVTSNVLHKSEYFCYAISILLSIKVGVVA